MDSYALSNYFFQNQNEKKALLSLRFLFQDPSLALEVDSNQKLSLEDILKLSTQEFQRDFVMEQLKKTYRADLAWHTLCRALKAKELLPFLKSKKVSLAFEKEHYYTLLYLGDKEALPFYVKHLSLDTIQEPENRIYFYQLEESIQESLWDILEESSK